MSQSYFTESSFAPNQHNPHGDRRVSSSKCYAGPRSVSTVTSYPPTSYASQPVSRQGQQVGRAPQFAGAMNPQQIHRRSSRHARRQAGAFDEEAVNFGHVQARDPRLTDQVPLQEGSGRQRGNSLVSERSHRPRTASMSSKQSNRYPGNNMHQVQPGPRASDAQPHLDEWFAGMQGAGAVQGQPNRGAMSTVSSRTGSQKSHSLGRRSSHAGSSTTNVRESPPTRLPSVSVQSSISQRIERNVIMPPKGPDPRMSNPRSQASSSRGGKRGFVAPEGYIPRDAPSMSSASSRKEPRHQMLPEVPVHDFPMAPGVPMDHDHRDMQGWPEVPELQGPQNFEEYQGRLVPQDGKHLQPPAYPGERPVAEGHRAQKQKLGSKPVLARDAGGVMHLERAKAKEPPRKPGKVDKLALAFAKHVAFNA